MMRCLWIARDIPFPLDAGDKIYSANMARAFAQTGAKVRFLGFAADGQSPPADWPIEWVSVPSRKHSNRRALFSSAPIAAAIHATAAYRQLLQAQLQEDWDVVLFDSYGSGWCLRQVLDSWPHQKPRPVLVHLSHNHEATLWHDMASNAKGNFLRRAALWQNYWKTRAMESALADSVDLITSITAEDAARFARQAPETQTVVLTPGYSGWMPPERQIVEATPRHVVIVGSFRWVVKQENLRQFIAIADQKLHANNIVLDVIGDVPAELLEELRPQVKATRFHGFVDSVAPFFEAARIAIVPELIGGGFKLKFLDYVFGRVPVATLTEAAAGLPASVRSQFICAADLPALVDAILANIDAIAELNTRQTQAYQAAGALFQWRDRGTDLLQAIQHIAAADAIHLAGHA